VYWPSRYQPTASLGLFVRAPLQHPLAEQEQVGHARHLDLGAAQVPGLHAVVVESAALQHLDVHRAEGAEGLAGGGLDVDAGDAPVAEVLVRAQPEQVRAQRRRIDLEDRAVAPGGEGAGPVLAVLAALIEIAVADDEPVADRELLAAEREIDDVVAPPDVGLVAGARDLARQFAIQGRGGGDVGQRAVDPGAAGQGVVGQRDVGIQPRFESEVEHRALGLAQTVQRA
jgi:hypothetical protein